MFILNQFTYNAFRIVELTLHKLVLLLWKKVERDKKTGCLKRIKREGGQWGFRLRASNWLETALPVCLEQRFLNSSPRFVWCTLEVWGLVRLYLLTLQMLYEVIICVFWNAVDLYLKYEPN